MFFVFSIIHFRESNQILKDIIYNDDNLCLQRGGVERKTTIPVFSTGADCNIWKQHSNNNPSCVYI